jgi:hypothetical protein
VNAFMLLSILGYSQAILASSNDFRQREDSWLRAPEFGQVCHYRM